MVDYTVIVDDDDPQIIYGPGADSWIPSSNNSAFRGTLHETAPGNSADFTFSFVGGREVFIRGNIAKDGNDTHSRSLRSTFQVDSQSSLDCAPESPQSGDTFLCSIPLPLEITNHTLKAVVASHDTFRPLQIDFIRYGTSSQVAGSMNDPVLFSQAPERVTPGIELDSSWETFQIAIDGRIIGSGQRTSKQFATAAYQFVGSSVDWWSCCMPPSDVSSTSAEISYSIDGGDPSFVTIDKSFAAGPHCLNERVLFQVDQLQHENHTLDVVYFGNVTTIPLTLCAIAASPVDFSILDTVLRTSPSSSNSSASASPSASSSPGLHYSINSKMTIILEGVVSGIAAALVLAIGAILWWRVGRGKRAKREAQTRRLSTDTILQLSYHPIGGFINPEKENPTVAAVGSSFQSPQPDTSENNGGNNPGMTIGASHLEARPPSYRSSYSKVESPVAVHLT